MSSCRFTRLLTLAVPTLCAAPLAAQTQRTKLFKRAPVPTREVQLDLGTGVYTHGPNPGSMLVTVRRSRSPIANGTLATPPIQRRVLIAGALLANFFGTHDGTTGSIATAVPLDFAYCGLHFAAQCRTTGGGLELSAAVEGTIGTF